MCILSKTKRLAAMCLAVLITLGTMGLANNDKSVTTKAVENPSEYEQELEKLEQQQKDLQNQLNQADANLNSEQEKLNNVVSQMEVISTKIQTSKEYSKEIEKEICTIDDKMRKTQHDLTDKEEKIKENVNGFMSRVRSMYLAGSTSYSDVLVNSSDFYDVLMRIELVKRVAEHDNKTIDNLIKQKKEIDKTKTSLESQKKKLSAKSKKYADEQKSLNKEYESLTSLQSEYGSSVAALQNNKDQLQNEVNNLIAEYQAKQAATATEAPVVTQAEPEVADTTTKAQSPANTAGKAKTTRKAAAQTTRRATAAPKTTTRATTRAQQVKPVPTTSNYSTKISTLMSTARSMVGGAYVWGGSSPYATDCSGLTMQCYAKIGINLPHLASAQAGYGYSVSASNMKQGDLIFFGGSSYSSIYHVAIYVGDGMMIHAENSNTGIVISYVSSFSRYNNITCVKRLL
ncbi:MAG: C40 family peptidase [Ruminococcus sp.]|nr:C40 family peptidase [Ruminococcus sp.]